MNSSGSFNLIAQAASLSMLQTMQGYAAAAAAAGSLRPGGMPSYYLHSAAMPQLRLPPQTVAPTGSILNARLLGAPQPAPTVQLSSMDPRPAAGQALVPLPGSSNGSSNSSGSCQSDVDNHHRHAPSQQQHHRQSAPPLAPSQTVGELVETTLEGKSIFAFDVGGEKRLCLPQVLNKVLLCAGTTLTDINRVCEDLNIFCDRCNSQQMSVLKELNVFGPVLESCGLITKSNAERLCKALLNGEAPKFQGSLTDEDGIGVYHTCFGKQRGFLIPRLYNSPDAPCILCNGPNGCQALLSPQQFVGHAHARQERETCHWGFDSTKWRLYLQLDKRLTDSAADGCLADSERACLEKVLDSVKAKFDRKRPQSTISNACCSGAADSAKRFKSDGLASSLATAGPKFLVPLPPDPANGIVKPAQLLKPTPVLLSSASSVSPKKLHSASTGAIIDPQVQQQRQAHKDYTPNVRLAPTAAVNRSAISQCSASAGAAAVSAAVAVAAERMELDGAAIEDIIASDWESLTDWGEGHLPEKATPQFLAMVEKVKNGYRAHIDSLVSQLTRLRGQAVRMAQLEAESARMRRQLEEQGSPDVRKLRMKYTAQKEELRSREEELASLKSALKAATAAESSKSSIVVAATVDGDSAEAEAEAASPPSLEPQADTGRADGQNLSS